MATHRLQGSPESNGAAEVGRRIVLHLPATFPWLTTWRRLALAVGAVPA